MILSFIDFCRKVEQLQGDVSVNIIAGSNKKRRKIISEQEEEESDNESVHTSDMSTDEEDSGVISDDEKEYSGGKTSLKNDNTATVGEGNEKDSCTNCEINRDIDIEGKEKGNDQTVADSNAEKSVAKESDSNAKENVTFVKTKQHARGTSGKWIVSELRTKVEVISENIKVENNTELAAGKIQIPKDKSETMESTKPKEVVVKPEDTVVKKVVNIPVEREKEIQVRKLFSKFDYFELIEKYERRDYSI